jgi:hypothetical protein
MKRAAVSLPDEVVLEILVRLKDDAATLFRCATACKAWRDLVADPSFLRRCWPEKGTWATIVGFFTRERHQGRPCFIPVHQSEMGRHALSAFLKVTDVSVGAMLERAVPIVSRRGLLPVRLPPDSLAGGVHLAVCNLLVGECHLLPPLECGGLVDERRYYWSGYALLSGADCRSDELSFSFKVAIIDSGYNLHTFTSGEGVWSTTPTTEFLVTGNYTPVCHDAAVVTTGGMAHWLFYDKAMSRLCTLDMDSRKGHLSLTSRARYVLRALPLSTGCFRSSIFKGKGSRWR